MNIILLGAPGAGKGTQARLIQEYHHLTLISTGDILRDEIERKTPLGLQVKETMAGGGYPSDDIILQIFEESLLSRKDEGVILDGLPRTLNQAQKIDEIFMRLNIFVDAVIQLSVDDGELLRRLSSRVLCKKCGAPYTADSLPQKEGICDVCSGKDFIRRPDDEPDVVKTRLDFYNERTKPLLQYYSKTNRLIVIDGMKPIAEVNENIESLLENLQVLTTKPRCLYSAQDV